MNNWDKHIFIMMMVVVVIEHATLSPCISAEGQLIGTTKKKLYHVVLQKIN